MFIGHLFAGYAVTKLGFPLFAKSGVAPKVFMTAGLVGALVADLDLLYFYFVDHGKHHHHRYWSHYPCVWGAMWLILPLAARILRARKTAAALFILTFNGMIHLCLDTIVGHIWWLAPFVDRSFALFEVAASYRPWWLNFVLHWTFGLELALVAWAGYLWRRLPPMEASAANGPGSAAHQPKS